MKLLFFTVVLNVIGGAFCEDGMEVPEIPLIKLPAETQTMIDTWGPAFQAFKIDPKTIFADLNEKITKFNVQIKDAVASLKEKALPILTKLADALKKIFSLISGAQLNDIAAIATLAGQLQPEIKTVGDVLGSEQAEAAVPGIKDLSKKILSVNDDVIWPLSCAKDAASLGVCAATKAAQAWGWPGK